MPGVRTALESSGLPGWFFAHAVKIVTKKRRFDIFAKFARGFVSREGNDADGVALWALPFAVIPRAGTNEMCSVGIMFGGVTENLPRSPGIFLIPEAGDIQIGNGGSMELIHPGFFFPEIVVIGMCNGIVPVRNRAVQIFRVDVSERAQGEIPLVGIVNFKIEIGVLIFVRLFKHGIFEVVALAQRAVAVIVIVHPLIDR